MTTSNTYQWPANLVEKTCVTFLPPDLPEDAYALKMSSGLDGDMFEPFCHKSDTLICIPVTDKTNPTRMAPEQLRQCNGNVYLVRGPGGLPFPVRVVSELGWYAVTVTYQHTCRPLQDCAGLEWLAQVVQVHKPVHWARVGHQPGLSEAISQAAA